MKQILIAAFIGLTLVSCTKNNETVLTGHTCNVYTQMEGGEDGDIIIINHKVVDANGIAIQGCNDTLTNDTDTFTCITDEMGVCVYQVPDTGTWYLNTQKDGYRPLHAALHITESPVTRVDTMYVQ